jgi:excisionase family DNA binding protein
MTTTTREPDRLAYSINEAVRVSSLGRSTIYRHIRAKRLELVRVGGRSLIPAPALHRLVRGEA